MDVNVQECKEIFSLFEISVALPMYRQRYINIYYDL